MGNYPVEEERVACCLGGIHTALAIEKVLPVLHCGPGCYSQSYTVLGLSNGGQSAYPFEGSTIPCTDFCETDVVFGGSERFRKIIEQSIEYYDADLFIAVDGCTAEIVGDDIEEVAGSFADSQKPVIYAKLPGFQGNNLLGHSRILHSIIEQYLEPTDKIEKGLVNIWGIVPFYDTLWEGTLEAIEETLKSVGLEANIIYGMEKGLKNVNRIPSAEFNLLLSPWIDKDIVELLQRKFGTPYLQIDHLPIGPTETKKFLDELAVFASLDSTVVETYEKAQEKRYYHYIQKHLPWMYGCKIIAKNFYIVSSASVALALTKYLVNDLGLVPKKIIIPEDVPEHYQEGIRQSFHDVELDNKDFDVIFTGDGGMAAELLKDEKTPESILLGSCWDVNLAKKLKMAFLPVSAPYGDRIVGDKSYFGYGGALTFFVDYYGALTDAGPVFDVGA